MSATATKVPQALVSDAAPADLAARAARCADAIANSLEVTRVDALCILGSGLGGAVDALQDAQSVPTTAIDELPQSTVEGHAGRLWRGRIGDRTVLMLQGRVHSYEGVPPWRSTLLVRAAARLGASVAAITNSAGAANPAFEPGDLMLLSDHLNLSGRNPLLGPHHADLGARFVDLTDAYDRDLRRQARAAAAALGLPLREGIYAWMLGPSYETPAEVRMARILGADAVGMSTVPEVIVARQEGLRALGLSCITNLGAGLSPTPLSHDEVTEVAGPAGARLGQLLLQILRNLAAP